MKMWDFSHRSIQTLLRGTGTTVWSSLRYSIPSAICVRIRFRGSHTEAAAQYRKLLAYIAEHNMTITGFSREITLIDYGITNDTRKFVTEISIPVEVENGSFKRV